MAKKKSKKKTGGASGVAKRRPSKSRPFRGRQASGSSRVRRNPSASTGSPGGGGGGK